MAELNIEVMAEKIRVLERENSDLKADIRDMKRNVEGLDRFKEITILKLSNIEKSVDSINTSVSKDSGWRGFFIDFIKAAAQIAVLVGAGKWIL